MDPDQTAPVKRLQNVLVDNNNIRLFVICDLRVNTCEVSDIRSGLS